MQRRLKIKKTAVLGTAVFVVALGGYVLSDAILQQNTLQLAKSSEREGEYAHLVSWLPQDAKLAIEYRAKYLFYQTRMNRARKLDAKVEAIFTFADYIKVKDPKGSDEMMVSLVTNPEYKNSRRAYRAYAFLLLNDKSRHPVQIREFHDYMKTLKWEEDIYYAWEEGQKRLNAMRAKDAVYLDFYAPLLENPKPYTNYDRFYTDIERRAPKVEGKQELAERAARIKADNKAGKRWLSQDLLRAPLEYRERYQDVKQSIAEAGTPEELVSALTSLAVLTRGKDDAESNATIRPAAGYSGVEKRLQCLSAVVEPAFVQEKQTAAVGGAVSQGSGGNQGPEVPLSGVGSRLSAAAEREGRAEGDDGVSCAASGPGDQVPGLRVAVPRDREAGGGAPRMPTRRRAPTGSCSGFRTSICRQW